MGLYLFSWAFLFSSVVLGTDLYHHEFIQYPRGEGCDTTAAELAKRFSDASGAEIYWAGATKETLTTCDIKFTYIAQKEVEFARNMDRSGSGSSRKGTKRSLEDCVADLQREKILFRNSTGLEPWVSYCYQESSFLNDLPFVPVIEGIGKPNLNFYSSATTFGVTPNIGWTPMLSSVWKTAAEQGHAIASITPRPYISEAHREVTIRYFSKERLYLRVDGIAEHKTPETCEEQVEQIRVGLAKAERPPIGVYCGKYASKQYRLGIATLSTNVLGIADLRPIEDAKQFPSLSACLTDLPTTLEFYRVKLGKRILAGICADGEGPFRITVIEERKPAPNPNGPLETPLA